ncbi:hypothetical protein BDV37DRAFT_278196 [Aspergillus pseudonomiae]|uniref:Cofilin n=1 Tax=Aspergillus pseudonomiae TaxID=1506151 RepID=A0A5N7DT68_9EURO|nr:uncharacterized protein BDV37DRAFT_278196 [Aspergillus pseudonomiae]KAE8409229.1 hypothetical protein BDV37DRAFT_278196 [Aspergillus pseudonomiae]
MASLPLSSECLEAYNALKLKKSFKYVIYGVDSTFKEIVVLKTSSASDYDEFMADLPDDECRWAVYDFAYKRSDGSERNKLVFISWHVTRLRKDQAQDDIFVVQGYAPESTNRCSS